MGISIIRIRRSRNSYIYNGNPYTGKMASLCWNSSLDKVGDIFADINFKIMFLIKNCVSGCTKISWQRFNAIYFTRFIFVNSVIISSDISCKDLS